GATARDGWPLPCWTTKTVPISSTQKLDVRGISHKRINTRASASGSTNPGNRKDAALPVLIACRPARVAFLIITCVGGHPESACGLPAHPDILRTYRCHCALRSRMANVPNAPVRLKDIAHELNVSVMTVSKVVRGCADVGAETRSRVL